MREIYTLSNKLVTKKFTKTPDDFAVSLLKFEDNSIAKISSNFSTPTDHHHVLELHSKNTSFFYNRNQSKQFFRQKGKKNNLNVKYKYNKKIKSEMLINFFQSILNNKKKLIISENELFYLMKICLMLVQSQINKKIIRL